MSVSFIMNSSIYAVRTKRKRKGVKSQLKYIGGDKRVMESMHRLNDKIGTVRKCLHYQLSPVKAIFRVNNQKVVLFDERTYTPEMLACKNEPKRNNNPKEPVYHKTKKRSRCGNVTRKMTMRGRKNGLRKGL